MSTTTSPPAPAPLSTTHHLLPLATCTPPSTARTWQTAPHPHLPLLATACADRTVRVYSLSNFALATTISGGHKRSVRALAWKPASRGASTLATGSFDASAGIWRKWEGGAGGDATSSDDFTHSHKTDEDEEEEEEEYNFASILDGHDSEIKSVAWSASGQYLATCSRDKSVWIWEELEDDDSFETVAVLQEHEADVKCVAWHPESDVLASASYDDTVRIYREDVDDWAQVARLEGHGKTVWWVEFEGSGMGRVLEAGVDGREGRRKVLEERERAGPRLLSASDDCTVRIWRKVVKEEEGGGQGTAGGVPSIFRKSIEEEWVTEAVLPLRHDRAIYAASWSRRSGMIVSTGSDGRIVVYKEQWKANEPKGVEKPVGVEGNEAATLTEWVVVAEIEGAHDVFEINHVCWAKRYDKGKRSEDEEVIVSTGDDGEVKVWTLEEVSSNNGGA
ncbi:cytosolic iron-sulfur protein assembly protein 1 [Mytilinidion resinicola]|uniref:Probable cytosolic iron-sulfur protein assembly protein 1 n=1 Tax=Mytilinidion resinicola TaxID=574789 RepID=A0A6A6YKE0_9PEZI|nr:cytosolic iron-sulfur protein assembly protein 1 [Mytilinidion resinicola]KAF2809336.1 cytosolic iron-sulfur protein assembly protein 1 [Mytilinidion resinicola]